MPLDWATLRTLTAMSDEIGVLSVYVTVDPREQAEPSVRPAFEVRIRNQLNEIRERLKREGPREHHQAFERRLATLEMEIERLFDLAGTGLGRALFAAVAGTDVHTVNVQVPLGDRVMLEKDAYVRPLVAAWSVAGPAGAVAVSEDEVRLVDLRFGLSDNAGAIPVPTMIEQDELKGPAAANPAMTQQIAPQHDLYARREEEKLLRFLRSVGPHVAEHADRWAWEHMVVTGEAPLVRALVDGLPRGWDDGRVTELHHPVATTSRARIAETVEPALAEARHRYRSELAARARDGAASGGNGATGLSETLNALAEGRVAHLLLSADGRWTGSRAPNGIMVPDGEVPPGASAGELVPEPHLAEKMIEAAFASAAKVTMLEPDEAEPLVGAGGDGVGALLRW